MSKRIPRLIGALLCGVVLGGQSCPLAPPNGDGDTSGNGTPPVYNNTTDRTNGGATWLGAAACRACHPDVDAAQSIHGHAHALTAVQGQPPVFPPAAERAAVPAPPDGFAWSQIAYVVGGYAHRAQFIDEQGYLLVTGATGVDTQWNLAHPATGTAAGFVPHDAERESPRPFDYACFVCHTTGAAPQTPGAPEFQDNRPGIAGTWVEPGVQCEACHGPGSNHVPNPSARDLFVDTRAAACGSCHTRSFNDGGEVISAGGGYIEPYQQYAELRASGGHANLDCVACHDPHASLNDDRERAIRATCRDCHPEINMALHEGFTFVRGSYRETLSCETCHLPFATMNASAGGADVVGETGRMGDTRTHIFRIDHRPVDYPAMFSEDMSTVARDDQGRAAVTVDFACLRCHNGLGNAFALTLESAAVIADQMHGTLP